MNDTIKKLTRKDFSSDQDVRWCPGCGDYAILATLQRTLPDLGSTRENTVFVSGIGCSSRFPYYMDTYGFHSIHGRAPAFATGVKIANPELDVWIITGDGDGLSIGTNHLVHLIRRNVNVQLLLFNNRIYGLTKGQSSPTTLTGYRSPSTPDGSVDHPLSPVALAIGANARFVARAIDSNAKQLAPVFKAAHGYKGTAFVEILQNCIVFHDTAWKHITEKPTALDTQIILEHGQAMIFGQNRDKGLRLVPGKFELEVVTIGEDSVSESDLAIHDKTNRAMAFLLGQMEPPHFPMALGVILEIEGATFDEAINQQVAQIEDKRGKGSIKALLHSGHTWTID